MTESEDREQNFLSHALICFSEAHYHQVTMANIAEQAGISLSELQQQYPEKIDILRALVAHIEQDLDDIMEDHAPSLESWRDIADLLLIYARLYVEEEFFSRYFTLIMFHLDRSEELKPVHEELSTQEWDFLQQIAEAIGKEREKTGFQSYLSDADLAQTIFASWEGVLTHAFYHRELETVLPRVKATLDMLYEGLLAGATKDEPE